MVDTGGPNADIRAATGPVGLEGIGRMSADRGESSPHASPGLCLIFAVPHAHRVLQTVAVQERTGRQVSCLPSASTPGRPIGYTAS